MKQSELKEPVWLYWKGARRICANGVEAGKLWLRCLSGDYDPPLRKYGTREQDGVVAEFRDGGYFEIGRFCDFKAVVERKLLGGKKMDASMEASLKAANLPAIELADAEVLTDGWPDQIYLLLDDKPELLPVSGWLGKYAWGE
jgi:hypothetical protein